MDDFLHLLSILLIDLGVYARMQLGLFRVEMRVCHGTHFYVVLIRFRMLIRVEVVRHNLVIVRH